MPTSRRFRTCAARRATEVGRPRTCSSNISTRRSGRCQRHAWSGVRQPLAEGSMHAPKVKVGTLAIEGGVRAALRHDSGEKHVAGEAIYVDDMRERAHALVKRLELERVRAQPGVAIVLAAKDVPGANDVSPFAGDDPVFADGLVQYHGQSLFAVAADTMAAARAAARLAVVDYADKPALLTVDQAMQAGSF